MTGFRTYSEFAEETTAFERELLTTAIRAWHAKRNPDRPTGGGRETPPGL